MVLIDIDDYRFGLMLDCETIAFAVNYHTFNAWDFIFENDFSFDSDDNLYDSWLVLFF